MSGGIHKKDTGLVLYSSRTSFYSQKARLALAWKGLKYEIYAVNMLQGEAAEPWFMRMNPKGQVPVLTDGDRIVPDSAEIITYLDEKYKTVGPRLQPDLSTVAGQEVKRFRDMLDSLVIGVITFGGIFFPELTEESQIPKLMRIAFAAGAKSVKSQSDEMKRRSDDASPDLKDAYLTKAKVWKDLSGKMLDKNVVQAELEKVEKVFTEVEKTLAEKNTDSAGKTTWLCADHQTEADICLAVTLQQLNLIGYRKRFWGNGKRPHLAKYYAQLLMDEHFQQESVQAFSGQHKLVLSLFVGKVKASLPYLFLLGLAGGALGFGLWYYRQR